MEGSLVDILVADSPVDIPVADSPVDNPAEGSPVDSSLPGVRIVADQVRHIRWVGDWHSRFEVAGLEHMVLEREFDRAWDCRDRRLDGLLPGRQAVDPEES